MTRGRRSGMLRLSADWLEHRLAEQGHAATPARVIASERETQAAVLEFLRFHPRVAWAHRANTGSGYLIPARLYRELVQQGALKDGDARYMQFGFPGAADITGQLRDGLRLEVEVKRKGEKLTDEQEAFLDAVNGARGVGFVAYRIEDIAEALHER